jgi:hypothetical protein
MSDVLPPIIPMMRATTLALSVHHRPEKHLSRPDGCRAVPHRKWHLEPIFEQFRCDVSACVKDAQDQHPLALDGKGNADGTPVTDNPQPRHVDPLGAPLWKSRQTETMVADTRNEIQAIAGNARPAISS